MNSAYSLIPMIREPCINAGETFEIEVFLTGYGFNVKNNKFRISHSSPKLLKQDEKGKVGSVETCIKALYSKEGKFVGIISGEKEANDQKAIEIHPLDPFGTIIVLNEGYFAKIPEKEIMSAGDLMHDKHPPILLKFNTSEKAPSGDYKIFLTLFYSEGKEVKINEKVVEIHINSWIEKHTRKLQAVAVLLGVLALTAGIVQAVYTVLQYLKPV